MAEESVINLIFIVSFGMVVLVLILLIILYFSRERVYKEKMKRQKLVVDHKKELLEHSYKAQEKERDRLAAELHDGIASKLNVIHVQLATIEKKLPTKIIHRIEIIKDALQTSIEDTRRISHDLFPIVLEKFGLVTALEELKELNRFNGIQTKIETNLKDKDLEMEKATHIYRIVQELVNNSLKHSNCREISIKLKKLSKDYRLIFADDGQGSLESLKNGKGLGIKSIETRLSVLSGTLEIEELNPGIQFKMNFK